jgi:hypothetical protein
MKFVVSKPPTLKEFINNLKEKQVPPLFLGDMEGLLSPDVKYDQWRFRSDRATLFG